LIHSPAGRGFAIACGAAAKFGPLALAPLFAAGSGERRLRSTLIFGAVFLAVWIVVLLPLLPDGGLREFYDRSFGYQASRGSPFSVWGLEPSLDWLQKLARLAPIVLGVGLFFLPRRRTTVQIAALGAALLILTQVGSTHWFYFFIVWWAPFVLVTLFCGQERIAAARSEPPPAPLSGPA
jgi:predicted secreted protein